MKKITFMLVALITFSVSAQKKKNGVIYDKHPGIDLVASFHEAITVGDIDKASLILHDDAKWYDGNSKDSEYGDKNRVLNNIRWFKNYFDYVSFKDTEGAYPDALEYKGDGNWVQSWFHVYGIHKNTGVKLDHPVLRIYSLNEDSSKITGIIEYSNKLEFRRIGDARAGNDMKNGTIYMNHEHINSVRKLMYAFANGDVDKAFTFFHENANYVDINETKGMNEEEIRARDAKLLSGWSITSLDETGYPDYLEYDWREGKVVQSWWNFTMVRQSDGKKVVVPVFYLDDFDNDGKITQRNAYWNASVLK